MKNIALTPQLKEVQPFTLEEATAIRAEIRQQLSQNPSNASKLVDGYWQEICSAAGIAHAAVPIAEIKLKRSNLGQKLLRISKAVKPRQMPLDYAALTALAFGAARLTIIKYPRTIDEFALRKILSKLTNKQLNECAAKALVEPLFPGSSKPVRLTSSNKGGQPPHEPLNDFISKLLHLYPRITGRRLPIKTIYQDANMKWHSVLKFVRVCLPEKTFGTIPEDLIRKAILRNRNLTK